jgi:hypothetical protein
MRKREEEKNTKKEEEKEKKKEEEEKESLWIVNQLTFYLKNFSFSLEDLQPITQYSVCTQQQLTDTKSETPVNSRSIASRGFLY